MALQLAEDLGSDAVVRNGSPTNLRMSHARVQVHGYELSSGIAMHCLDMVGPSQGAAACRLAAQLAYRPGFIETGTSNMEPVATDPLPALSFFPFSCASSSVARDGCRIVGVGASRAGEDVCADTWRVMLQADCCLVKVANGVGHGLRATAAAPAAVRRGREHPARRMQVPTGYARPGYCRS